MIPFLLSHIQSRFGDCAAGIVHKNIDLSVFGHRCIDQCFDTFLFRDICRAGIRVISQTIQLAGHPFTVRSRTARNDDFDAVAGKRGRDRQAQTFCTARYDRYFSFQIKFRDADAIDFLCHDVSSCEVVF